MSEDTNMTGHLVKLAAEMGRLSAEVSGLKAVVTNLQTTVEAQQVSATQMRFGGRLALIAISIFGGVAGSKIAHSLGFLTDNNPHN